MAANTDPGHWLLRGIQSAVFYYASCSPCLDQRYKNRRRKEARTATHEVVSTQPGSLRQPTAFQTNEQWGEELILGPGPPKPWKPDEMLARVKQKLNLHPPDSSRTPDPSRTPPEPSRTPDPRPSMDRRVSDALGNVKESLRQSLHPEKWNWKRYDREDEVLRGLGDKVTRIWDKVISTQHEEPAGIKRAFTNESDQDYTRGRIPAVNDLHPPVVSQLPGTREEAAWMLLPPPSAAVMNGKTRPGDEMTRRPLCVIGARLPEAKPQEAQPRPPEEESDWESDGETPRLEERPGHSRHQSAPVPSARPPFLSDTRHFSDPTQLLEQRPAAATNPEILDTTSDILPLAGSVTPKPRPSSWQFHYIIPNSMDV